MSNHIVIIPVEVYAREIDHKLLLGYYLSHFTGCPVLIAKDNIANSLAFRYRDSAIYIGKNFYVQADAQLSPSSLHPKVENSQLLSLLDAGVNVIFADEEGGLYLDGSFSNRDKQLFWSRMPLNDHQSFSLFPNLWMAHWGSYQTSIAQELLPKIKHATTGAFFLDACKAYRQCSSEIPNSSLSPKIGVISSTCPLTQGSYQVLPTYLSIDLFIKNYGPSYTQQALLAESTAAFLSDKLTNDGYDVTYRPHPASSGLILSEWKRYCSASGISLSLPSSDTILSFLSRHTVTIHTAGCTTALQSFFLGLSSVFYGDAKCGTSDKLLSEAHAQSYDELVSSIDFQPRSTLLPLASLLLNEPFSSDFVSFQSILTIVQAIIDRSVADSPVSRSIHFGLSLLNADIFARLRNLRFWKTPKFRNLRVDDIQRNLSIARALWPNDSLRIRSRSSQHILLY